ncbi:MAG: ribosomal RNA small subunit methyltransferase A [Deltaproteobacteria bacterium]|nr:ribosomal RNA small subunit methyltransferase A [Deltaproteobacteria bacterium]
MQKKYLGQHFLKKESVALNIVNNIPSGHVVVEIGAGKGALTKFMVERGLTVKAVEIDKSLVDYLKKRFKDRKNIEIIHGDGRDFIFPEDCVIVGNLPYNVSKRIIRNIILQKEKIVQAILMVQREVAEVMLALPSSSHYNRFSVFVQFHFCIKRLFSVPPDAFFPKPKVYSSCLLMIPTKTQIDNEGFLSFLSKLFLARRKTVYNNLRKAGLFFPCADSGQKLHIDEFFRDIKDKRPQELSGEQILKMYEICRN